MVYFCVAVIHHLENIDNRKKAINELIRVTKPNGKIFIQVWANNINKTKKFINIDNNDYYVTWRLNKTNENIKRYYHLFTKDELIKLIDFNLVSLIDIIYELNNWIIIIKKN